MREWGSRGAEEKIFIITVNCQPSGYAFSTFALGVS
jgi:hypothetical protein